MLAKLLQGLFRSIALLLCLGLALSASATSIVFHKFSKPIFQKDRLFFTSPDSKRLICIGLNGSKIWEKPFAGPISLFQGPKGVPLLQSNQTVCLVSPTGELALQFAVEDANDKVSYREDCGLFVSHDRGFDKRTFKLIDKKSGKPLWTNREVESLVGATPDLLLTLRVERIPDERAYSYGSGTLEAFERNGFTRRWQVKITEKGVLHLESVLVGPHLIYADGTSLTVIEIASGRKLATKNVDVPRFGRLIDVQGYGDGIVWLTSEYRSRDFNQTEHTLHFCSVPDLKESRVVTLKLIEIANVAFEGDFIISDALYRTAGFKMNGEKIWERFQSSRTKTIDGRIYFSDYRQKTTRLGYVEVSSGKETILYSEPLP